MIPRPAFIYLLLDADGSPRYVGKSIVPWKRLAKHKVNKDWACTLLIIEAVSHTDRWQDRERFWIAYYSQWYVLENIASGGNGPDSVSEATREKLRRIGLETSHETILKRSLSNTGKKRSDETREKLRRGRLGKIQSPAARLKISAAGKGRSPVNKGVPPSDRTKIRLRIANLGKVCPNIILLAKKLLPRGYSLRNRKQSQKWIDARVKSITGRRWTEQERENHLKSSASAALKISASLKGKPKPEWTQQRYDNWYAARWGNKKKEKK